MTKDDKKIEATGTPQAVNDMDKDEVTTKLVTAMLAGKTVDTKQQLDLPIDVGFVAQVPFIIGGIG